MFTVNRQAITNVDDDEDDSTAPYREREAFKSLWDALRWKHVRKRVPVCFNRTLHNRYMLANLVYLSYTIALLVIDFHPGFTATSSDISTSMELSNDAGSTLDQPVIINLHANRLYIALAGVNILVAFLYVWAWRDRSWFDVVLIPEYLNHVQAALYLWSALWYPKQETIGDYYAIAVHRIELYASCVELCTAVGWMISWYMTYTRTFGRGFTFDDPDTMGYLATTTNTLLYFVYNIQMNIHPEQYGSNQLYIYADVLGFIGSIYYIFAALRDDKWLWFLPLAGQYAVAAGSVQVETKTLPKYGLSNVLITDENDASYCSYQSIMVTYQGASVTIIDEKDSTSPIYEFESFTSITKALQWKHVSVRVPICLRKLLGSRYMLANLVYLIYSTGILIINFHPSFNEKSIDTSQVLSKNLDSPVNINPNVNGYYIGLGVLHLLSASLYLWAWRDRSWFDIVMIPEYLNHIEAGLYLWSAFWYSRQDILGGYYTLAVHKIELVATTIELIASFGWIMSWYMTYTRTLGRGFTLDDPDTIAYLTTTISSLIYVVYNIQINLYPEEYGRNMLYKYSDVLYFVGAWYYIFAGLRDENCFWFLPLAGQYGVAAGRIRVETKELPKYGKSPIFITDLCKRRLHAQFNNRNDLSMINSTVA
ncbi:unnamed protein product [Rotaria magnacalcarata]|uniref:Uncharacterized protein n=1 Tax=Rotaria magnacalcarata TaxID=392030 RepID=A0A816LCJ0_9BILA|nr:unnamed protein product [Rotaria magnacalcarata]